MLQDLTRSAIVLSEATPAGTGAAIRPLPLSPGEVDLNECSLDNLVALADVAYRAGDLASAEAFMQRFYARYDRRQRAVAKAKAAATAAGPHDRRRDMA